MTVRSTGFCLCLMLAAGCGEPRGSRLADDGGADLQRRAAELQPDVERLSGLPSRSALKLGVRSRQELESFLAAELDEQFRDGRIEDVTRVYARLGLVPDSLDLAPLLSRLLLEQVVGFYDPASDTLFVVAGVAAELVDAVLVHEMVHALQDQYVDLDSLVEATRHRNDAAMAVQAALEGHATYVMVEWMMQRELGAAVDLSEAPLLGETMAENPLGVGGAEMPELEGAPSIIRQQLLFPYMAGLDFVQVRWRAPSDRTPPIGDQMPVTTEQILHPGWFGTDRARPPPSIRFTNAPTGDMQEVHTDGLGEFDLRVLLREFLPSREVADAAAEGWDGDRYRLLVGPAGESLVWVSRWDTPNDAREFGDAVERALRERYRGVRGRSVSVRLIGDRIVRVEDLPSALLQGLPADLLVFSEG